MALGPLADRGEVSMRTSVIDWRITGATDRTSRLPAAAAGCAPRARLRLSLATLAAAIAAALAMAFAGAGHAEMLPGVASHPESIVPPERASRLLVDKSERTLVLFRGDRPIATFPISLGLNPRGHKQQEGDRRTPEGIYLIDFKNPDSAYYRSLRISYPNERDRLAAEERGIEPGGQIMIHGTPNGRLIRTSSAYSYDWTDGCIAVSNAHMDEIWRLVDVGTLIEIRP